MSHPILIAPKHLSKAIGALLPLSLLALITLFPGDLWAQTPKRTSTSAQPQAACGRSISLNFGQIVGIAVYDYNSAASKLDLPYNVRDIQFTLSPDEVGQVATALDYRGVDGREIGASPCAYVFLKYSSGKVKKARVIGWRYLVLGNDWQNMCPLPENSGRILEEHKQPAPTKPEAQMGVIPKPQ